MKVTDYIGKKAVHKDLGEVLVVSAPPKSKKRVNIKVIQRGKGWDENTNSYKRYFVGSFLQEDGSRSLRWRFTNRDQYGYEDQVSVDTLSII